MNTLQIRLLLSLTLYLVVLPSQAQDNRIDGRFYNIYPELHARHGFWQFVQWRWRRQDPVTGQDLSKLFPISPTDLDFLRTNTSQVSWTWIGHATGLLQIAGINILTDPQFSQRASPVQWAGPKRYVQPAIPLTELPEIQLVVISHDHYDSLDLQSIRGLYNRPGGRRTLFLVPMALKAWFLEQGIENVVELDWWQSHQYAGLEISAVPAQHWSKRSFWGRNSTLWAGWVIRHNDFRFYFAGDSGYAPHFRAIGQRLGPFDLAAIPIGAYAPRWFMKPFHINPSEAVQAHLDLASRLSVAIHWGTFPLTDEPLTEPPELLYRALDAAKIERDRFRVLQHGQTLVVD